MNVAVLFSFILTTKLINTSDIIGFAKVGPKKLDSTDSASFPPKKLTEVCNDHQISNC